jgi:hypothetical protein
VTKRTKKITLARCAPLAAGIEVKTQQLGWPPNVLPPTNLVASGWLGAFDIPDRWHDRG